MNPDPAIPINPDTYTDPDSDLIRIQGFDDHLKQNKADFFYTKYYSLLIPRPA
jgi:hypothetical protein